MGLGLGLGGLADPSPEPNQVGDKWTESSKLQTYPEVTEPEPSPEPEPEPNPNPSPILP